MDAPKPIYTIGYEGRTVDEVVERLEALGVHGLLDVRRHPYVRGGLEWNTNRLEQRFEGLPMNHLWYTLVEEWGNAKGAGVQWMPCDPAWQVHLMMEVDSLARVPLRVICLLCKERDAADCHRRDVADLLAAMTGREVVHL